MTETVTLLTGSRGVEYRHMPTVQETRMIAETVASQDARYRERFTSGLVDFETDGTHVHRISPAAARVYRMGF